MRKKWIIITALLSVTGFIAIAGMTGWIGKGEHQKEMPDAKDELKKIYAVYMNNEGYDISGTMNIYDEENKHALKEQTTFCNARYGGDYYSQLSQLQTFVVDSFLVRIDTIERIITLSGITADQADLMKSKVFPFDNNVADTSSFALHLADGEDRGQRALTMESSLMPEIKSMSIYYDKENYTIRRAEIQWLKTFLIDPDAGKKKYWLSDIRFNEKKNSVMDIRKELGKVLTIKGNEIALAEKYKGYKIVAIPAETETLSDK